MFDLEHSMKTCAIRWKQGNVRAPSCKTCKMSVSARILTGHSCMAEVLPTM
jgi:arginyl-tRNA--protein-N-Asp/Glu arginylyltransferase